MATETASVLFTDLVGSTELRQRLGEERADALHRRHDALVTEAIEANGGRVVKGLGDGVMAVFGAAADAVTAAVAVQTATNQHTRSNPDAALDIRIGISVGDVSLEGGDYLGSAVVEASRLCGVARGGEILVADLVRALTRGRGGFTFESMGELELKGLDGSVPACSVVWETAPATGAGAVPFPHLLAATNQVTYTGRLGLRADLQKAWDLVTSGAGSRTVLLVGEPGVGKTRTASELARAAHADGTLVLYGRCDEKLGLSYEPFVEALDWQTAHDPALPLGRFPGDLRRLVPDLDTRVDGLPPAIRSDPRAEEHRLFEATASWLVDVARGGLVLVLDDLHWGTRPTLQMMLHVIRTATARPDTELLVLGTYRDTDVDRTHPLVEILADLRRLPGVERLPVEPLSESEVLDFIRDAAGQELDADALDLARRAYAETEGNPFFVGEVLRHFIETGVVRFEDGRWVVHSPDRVDVPEGVRDVVGRRLNRLSDRANSVLTVASVIGRDFGLDVVTDVADTPVDSVLDSLDEAVRARLIDEIGADRFRFGHALTRQTLYEELSATRRRRLHRRVAEALERVRPDDLAALAHHSVEAGPVGGDLSLAIRYTLGAGEQALAARAVADAVAQFQRCLELLDETDVAHPADRLRARCGLAEAQRDLGDPGFREALLDVTADAVAAGVTEVAVRAAVANGRIITSIVGSVDRDRVTQLEAVIGAADELAATERALLLAALATELTGSPPDLERRLRLSEEATALAEESGDSGLLARVLVATANACNTPERVDAVHDSLVRAVEQADLAGDPTLRSLARIQLVFVLEQRGAIAAARELYDEARRIADEEGYPTVQWMVRCFGAKYPAWEGDLEATRRANEEARELGERIGEQDAASWWAGTELGRTWADGTIGAAADLLAGLADVYEGLIGYRMSQALALCMSGRTPEARDLVERHGLGSATAVPDELFTFSTWGVQAQVLHHLGLTEEAAALAELLEAHADRGWSTTGVWLFMPLRVSLAQCLLTAGRLAEAGDVAALAWQELHASSVRSSIPAVTAVVVAALDAAGRRDEARAAAERGLAEARAMGMEQRVAELTEVLADLDRSTNTASGA